MQQVEVGEIGWLQFRCVLEERWRGNREYHRIGELHHLNVIPIAGSIANSDVGFTCPEIRQHVGGVD